MQNEITIEEAKQAIQFLQRFVGEVAGGKPAVGNITLAKEDIATLWSDQDLKINFNISTSTIYRRRKDGTFKFFKIGALYYYYPNDILPLRYRFLK